MKLTDVIRRPLVTEKSTLQRELGSLPGLVDIRGEGLMLGVELDRPCTELTLRAAQAGLLISVTADKVIRLVPPLIFTEADVAETLRILVPLVREVLGQTKP